MSSPSESRHRGSTLPDIRHSQMQGGAGAATIRDLLRASITRGAYDDRPLPPEAELQRIFDASRSVVRQALEMLGEEHLVERVRGAGTFVATRKTKQTDGGFSGLGGPGTSLVNVVTGRRVIRVQEMLTGLLAVPIGTEVLRLDRQTIGEGGQVVSWFTSYLPLAMAQPLAWESSDLSGEYFATVERLLGVRIRRVDRMIEAVSADSVTAAIMRISPGAAILRHERVLRVDDEHILEFAIGRQRGDQVALLRSQTRD